VAQDDPQLAVFEDLADKGLADLVVLPSVGCEAFAEYVFAFCEKFLADQGMDDRVRVHSVECREHEGNSAIYAADDDDIIVDESTFEDDDEDEGDPGIADDIVTKQF
jgi:hypothetical protein